MRMKWVWDVAIHALLNVLPAIFIYLCTLLFLFIFFCLNYVYSTIGMLENVLQQKFPQSIFFPICFPQMWEIHTHTRCVCWEVSGIAAVWLSQMKLYPLQVTKNLYNKRLHCHAHLIALVLKVSHILNSW